MFEKDRQILKLLVSKNSEILSKIASEAGNDVDEKKKYISTLHKTVNYCFFESVGLNHQKDGWKNLLSKNDLFKFFVLQNDFIKQFQNSEKHGKIVDLYLNSSGEDEQLFFETLRSIRSKKMILACDRFLDKIKEKLDYDYYEFDETVAVDPIVSVLPELGLEHDGKQKKLRDPSKLSFDEKCEINLFDGKVRVLVECAEEAFNKYSKNHPSIKNDDLQKSFENFVSKINFGVFEKEVKQRLFEEFELSLEFERISQSKDAFDEFNEDFEIKNNKNKNKNSIHEQSPYGLEPDESCEPKELGLNEEEL